MRDRRQMANRSRNRVNDLKDFIQTDPSKWKGMKHLLNEEMEEVKQVVKHLPVLEVQVRMMRCIESRLNWK